MKLVINTQYGGFGLSLKAQKEYLKLKGKEAFFYQQTKYAFQDGVDEYSLLTELKDNQLTYTFTKNFGEIVEKFPEEAWKLYYFYDKDISREDPDLVKVVEQLGTKEYNGSDANGRFAVLKVVEIPDNVEFQIEEYDGREWVAERHRTWS
jgi:hypothetical protein